MPKIVPKSIQTCFEHVLGQTFRKIFAQFSMECRVFDNFQKKYFQNSKIAQNVPKSIQTCFRVIFSKKIYAQCSMEGRVFENFPKFFFFKIPKMPKIVPKIIQTCFERVLGQTFRKFFAQFSTAFRILENFQKNRKKIQNSKNAQNRSQKNPNVF